MLISLPLNAGAAAWMAMSMDNSSQHSITMDSAHKDHMESTDTKSIEFMDIPHSQNHDESDCEEHCLSCSNHCSTTVIGPSSQDQFDLKRLLDGVLPGVTLISRLDTPFRPPILI